MLEVWNKRHLLQASACQAFDDKREKNGALMV